ncbi:hypothetical protein MRB53_026242 [Persea americana]|uniref:Uncharacterized protein n=1 Tax=Persea americana TaxID=3435 RepID=A0ACC2LHM0_PERAE|nr:hypothetical protein MRB53_026242 [Persea americana]
MERTLFLKIRIAAITGLPVFCHQTSCASPERTKKTAAAVASRFFSLFRFWLQKPEEDEDEEVSSFDQFFFNAPHSKQKD